MIKRIVNNAKECGETIVGVCFEHHQSLHYLKSGEIFLNLFYLLLYCLRGALLKVFL